MRRRQYERMNGAAHTTGSTPRYQMKTHIVVVLEEGEGGGGGDCDMEAAAAREVGATNTSN